MLLIVRNRRHFTTCWNGHVDVVGADSEERCGVNAADVENGQHTSLRS